SRSENFAAVRQAMVQQGAAWHWVSSLDDIAWLLNLRASDVSYNPVFLAHLLLGLDDARLFIDVSRIDDALREALRADGVRLLPYDQAARGLADIPAEQKVLIDPA